MGCLFVWYWIVNLIQWRVTLCRSRMMTWVVLVPTVFHETWSSNSYNSPAEFKNSSDHRKRSWCCRELLRGRISFLCFLFVNRASTTLLVRGHALASLSRRCSSERSKIQFKCYSVWNFDYHVDHIIGKDPNHRSLIHSAVCFFSNTNTCTSCIVRSS